MSMTITNWLQSPQGRYVMAWEAARVDALVCDLFGYHALQFGLPEHDFLRHNRIPYQCVVGTEDTCQLQCDFRELPFDSQCIDLIVLPHILEFHPDPHAVLREVERVLIPEGQLIISGFNPFSLWGMARHLSNRAQDFPYNGRYISISRLKDWLTLLNCQPDRGHFGCYVPPLQQQHWLKNWHFMESAGDRWWSFAGGVYLIRAVKRVKGMRLIMPKWRKKIAPNSALSPLSHSEKTEHSCPTKR